jgi:hypothetical protein
MARSAGCPALSALRSEARAAQGGGCLRPPSPWAILSRPVGPIGIGSNLWVMASPGDPRSLRSGCIHHEDREGARRDSVGWAPAQPGNVENGPMIRGGPGGQPSLRSGCIHHEGREGARRDSVGGAPAEPGNVENGPMISGGPGGWLFSHKYFASRASRPNGPGKDSPGRRERFATAALGNSVAGPRPDRCGTRARSAGCPALSALRSEARTAQGGGCLRPPSPWAILSRPVGPIGIASNLWVMASPGDPRS